MRKSMAVRIRAIDVDQSTKMARQIEQDQLCDWQVGRYLPIAYRDILDGDSND